MKGLLTVVLATLLMLAGCSQGQKVYDNPDSVSIFLYDEPVVEENSYSIRLRFQHNEDEATHLIQRLEWNWQSGEGIEAFRTHLGQMRLGQRDRHYSDKLTYEKRTMTVMAGKVEGSDETFLGFSMLPSEWPQKFNQKYLANHKITGKITKEFPETATQYTIEFNRGVLTFEVLGTEVKYVWVHTPTDGAAED